MFALLFVVLTGLAAPPGADVSAIPPQDAAAPAAQSVALPPLPDPPEGNARTVPDVESDDETPGNDEGADPPVRPTRPTPAKTRDASPLLAGAASWATVMGGLTLMGASAYVTHGVLLLGGLSLFAMGVQVILSTVPQDPLAALAYIIWGTVLLSVGLCAAWVTTVSLAAATSFVPLWVTALGASVAAWTANQWAGGRRIPLLRYMAAGMVLPALSVVPGLVLHVLLVGMGAVFLVQALTPQSSQDFQWLSLLGAAVAWAAGCLAPVALGVASLVALPPVLAILAATLGKEAPARSGATPAE